MEKLDSKTLDKPLYVSPKCQKHEPVKLVQDYRQFDFLSPWEGARYILPGDDKAAPKP